MLAISYSENLINLWRWSDKSLFFFRPQHLKYLS
jgi:hypothetical protein